MAKQVVIEDEKPTPKKPKHPGTVLSPPGQRNLSRFKAFVLVKILFPIGYNMSGRGNGIVYKKNGIVANFSAPPVFNTPAATRSKSLFGGLQTGFGLLTQEQQKSWNDYGFTYINVWSESKQLSGRSAYVRLNTNLRNTSQALLTTPPVVPNIANLPSNLVLTADDSAHTLSLAYTNTTDRSEVMVFATSPQRSTIFKPNKSKYKFIGYFASDSVGPVTLTNEYNAVYGTDAVSGVDKKIFVVIQSVADTGNTSVALAVDTIIVT